MRKALLALVLALAAAADGFAGLGSGGRPRDDFVADEVSFARRGSLGQDSYVVTNVYAKSPCYQLSLGGGAALRDRTVNRRTVTADTVFAVPPVPARRTFDPDRMARAFVLVVEVPPGPVPEISFSGMSRTYTDGCGIRIANGLTVINFVEVGDGEFMVDSRTLEPVE